MVPCQYSDGRYSDGHYSDECFQSSLEKNGDSPIRNTDENNPNPTLTRICRNSVHRNRVHWNTVLSCYRKVRCVHCFCKLKSVLFYEEIHIYCQNVGLHSKNSCREFQYPISASIYQSKVCTQFQLMV